MLPIPIIAHFDPLLPIGTLQGATDRMTDDLDLDAIYPEPEDNDPGPDTGGADWDSEAWNEKLGEYWEEHDTGAEHDPEVWQDDYLEWAEDYAEIHGMDIEDVLQEGSEFNDLYWAAVESDFEREIGGAFEEFLEECGVLDDDGFDYGPN